MEPPRQQFLSESEDLLDQVFASLDELREHPTPQQQRELIANIFRQVHRLKGAAASFGFTGLAEIAHEFEHLLTAMRAEAVALNDDVVDACESATLALSESLTLATSGVIEPSRRELFASLRAFTPAAEIDPIFEASIDKVISQLPAGLAQALTDNEKRHMGRRYAAGNSLCVVTTSFEIAGFEEQFYSLKEKLAEVGDVISTAPAVDPNQAERVSFGLLLASDKSVRTLEKNLQMFPTISITKLTPVSDIQKQAVTATGLASTHALPTTFIRTDLNDLDQLLSATNELSRLTTKALDGAQGVIPTEQQSQFKSQAADIRRSFLKLQSELIRLRMARSCNGRLVREGRQPAPLISKLVSKSLALIYGSTKCFVMLLLIRSCTWCATQSTTALRRPQRARRPESRRRAK